MTTYSGFTASTPKNLLLDAGAFFKNFDIASDTFASAVAAGKLLGATSGGGVFSAIPTMRPIEIDGVKGAAKGLQVIDEWVVTLTANVKEISKDILKMALAAGSIDTGTNSDYDIITAANYVVLTDYIDNVTWVGKLSGTNDPVIIQVFNSLSTGGLSLTTADKAEATLPITFTGHYEQANLDNPPFKIYYPKAIVNSAAPASADFSKAAPADKTITITTSDGAVAGGVRNGSVSLVEGQYTFGVGTVLIKSAYLGSLSNATYTFTILMDKGNDPTANIVVGA